jgi:hypothetical protein
MPTRRVVNIANCLPRVCVTVVSNIAWSHGHVGLGTRFVRTQKEDDKLGTWDCYQGREFTQIAC